MADTTSKSLLRSYKYHHSTRSFAHSFLRKKFEASYVHFEENSRFAEPDFGKIDLRRKNASRCRTDPHVDYRMSLFTIHSQRPQQHIPGFFNFLFYASGVDAVNAGVWMCFRACLIVQCRCCHLGRRYDVARASRAYIQLKSLYPAQILISSSNPYIQLKSIGGARRWLRGPCPPKFLEYPVIFCFERRYPNKILLLAYNKKFWSPKFFGHLQRFWTGYALLRFILHFLGGLRILIPFATHTCAKLAFSLLR